MASVVRVKISIIIGAVFILTFIPLLKSNFNAPVTIKRWEEKLTWDDFRGLPPPFQKWGAAISSNVYLKYDTANKRFEAFAGQNNQQSWVKNRTRRSNYALNHEQYHFNITELHSRMMNAYLQQNQDKNEVEYIGELKTIRNALNAMQNEYDAETNHGLNVSEQSRWEYKTDSLLQIYSTDPGFMTEDHSGAQIYFPVKPEIRDGIEPDDYSYRRYLLNRYDMVFSLTVIPYPFLYTELLEENLVEYNRIKSYDISRIKLDSSRYDFEAEVEALDSFKEKIVHQVWVYHNNCLCQIMAVYPCINEDITGYKKNAFSFMESFKIIPPTRED